MTRKFNYEPIDSFDQNIEKKLKAIGFEPSRTNDLNGIDYDKCCQVEGASKRFYKGDVTLRVPYENLFEAIAAEKEGKRFVHSIDYRMTLFVPIGIPNLYFVDFNGASAKQFDQLMSDLEQKAVSTWSAVLDDQKHEHEFGFCSRGIHAMVRLPYAGVAPSEVVKKSVKYITFCTEKAEEIKKALQTKYDRAVADFKKTITTLPLRVGD